MMAQHSQHQMYISAQERMGMDKSPSWVFTWMVPFFTSYGHPGWGDLNDTLDKFKMLSVCVKKAESRWKIHHKGTVNKTSSNSATAMSH